MSDEMEARLLARVRHQFRSHAIDFAGWETTGPSNVRVATYRVTDAVVAGRMRDRGFRVVDTNGRVSAVVSVGRQGPVYVAIEPLDTPAEDHGMEMFGRVCQWGAGVVLLLTVLSALRAYFSGGGQ